MYCTTPYVCTLYTPCAPIIVGKPLQVLYAVFASVMLCLGAPFWHNHLVLIQRQDYKVV